jgi:hypothetical protein
MLLVVADTSQRNSLADACRGAGYHVSAVSRICEIEQWPTGEMVVTDEASRTNIWRNVGAAHVIVMTDAPGHQGYELTTTTFVPCSCTGPTLVRLIDSLATRGG